jgi:alpha-ketoglutarate-dependent taurine dioxygenase
METGIPIKKLSAVPRRAVTLERDLGVRARPLRVEGPLPLLVEPAGAFSDLAGWAGRNRDWLATNLLHHGGILFRGFPIRDLGAFQQLIEAACGEPLEYRYRSTPRTRVAGNIYTSTEYPADQEIPLHNENSYSRSWPLKIFFFCELPAASGGVTPIADSARVFERIPPAVRERFERHGVMYVRNYGGGADLPWQEVFQTSDRAVVEAFCRDQGIELEWRDEARLLTRQVCQAVAHHPSSGKPLWFNQAHLFHVSSLQPQLREALLEVFGEQDLPRNTFFGDGSRIEDEMLDEVRQVYRAESVAFPWEQGDVLLLDNMAVAHGRSTYQGERRIRVGMAEQVASTFRPRDATGNGADAGASGG